MSAYFSHADNLNGAPETNMSLRVGRLLLVALLLSGFIATALTIWRQSQTANYHATATILILAPHERYIPTTADQQNNLEDQAPKAIIREAEKLLFAGQKPEVLKAITSGESGWLAALMDWTKGIYQAVATQSDGLDGRQDKTSLHFDPALRTLSITVWDTDRFEVMNAANDLANAYLAALKDRRTSTFDEAVAKLASDIAAIQMQQVALSAQLAPNPAPPMAKAENRLAWSSQEAQRIAGVQKSIDATERILNNMRALHQQALTKQKYDLLPPEARLLMRAALPDLASESKAGLLFIQTLGIAFLAIAGLMIIRARRRHHRMTAMSSARPDLPVILPVSSSSHHDHLPAPDAPEPVATPDQTDSPVASEQRPSSIDLPHIVHHIANAGRKRVVLMSDCAEWSRHVKDLTLALMEKDLAILLVKLGAGDCANDPCGITDLIDQTAGYGDLVQIEEETGLHQIGAGSRTMLAEDFFSHDFHALLLALEQACDVVLIDLAAHYDNDFALKSLGIARDALACIYAPDTDPDTADQVASVMEHFGYQDCLIINQATNAAASEMDLQTIAAE